jgi:hypothetical protein
MEQIQRILAARGAKRELSSKWTFSYKAIKMKKKEMI